MRISMDVQLEGRTAGSLRVGPIKDMVEDVHISLCIIMISLSRRSRLPGLKSFLTILTIQDPN